MTEFKPGTSPPPVKMPMRFADNEFLLGVGLRSIIRRTAQ
jgi:hypothetical protein